MNYAFFLKEVFFKNLCWAEKCLSESLLTGIKLWADDSRNSRNHETFFLEARRANKSSFCHLTIFYIIRLHVHNFIYEKNHQNFDRKILKNYADFSSFEFFFKKYKNKIKSIKIHRTAIMFQLTVINEKWFLCHQLK